MLSNSSLTASSLRMQPRINYRTAACALLVTGVVATPAMAQESRDTILVPQKYALEREIEVDVTPNGLVLNLGAPVRSANLSHMNNVVFVGLDGVLCDSKTECSEAPRPTMLLLRQIPPIAFKDQLPSSDGTRMFFVNTDSGLYRFRLKPSAKPSKVKAPYTEVKIQPDYPASPSQFPFTR